MLANVHIFALVDVSWIFGVRLTCGMLPLLQGSVLGVSFNDLEVERDKFLSCARVQVSASMYVLIPLSCPLRIEHLPTRNTATHSPPWAL